LRVFLGTAQRGTRSQVKETIAARCVVRDFIQKKLALVTLTRAVLCFSFVLLVSCSDQPPPVHSLGDAYVGPGTLNLRRDLAPKSPVSATLKHGDKLAVIEYRHRLVKVRTEQGAEGWTDARQLLTPAQMNGLRDMAESASRFPSQGAATVFESLNLHTEPSRTSPSYGQIPENGKADVIGHKLMPRVQSAEVSMPTPVRPPPRKKAKPKSAQTRIGPPAPGPAPKPPQNWLALSVPEAAPAAPAPPPPPANTTAAEVPMDDWSLVRTHDGKVGWVLTRPLSMAIPDEVAQYAEGHRITSYFVLGQVHDRNTVKNNWLWTTITKGGEPYEFDSFRVFVWSLRHHHYETAYIERNIVGYYPVQVSTTDSSPSFSVVLEANDGRRYRKTYSFEGFHIRMVAREPYTPAPEAEKRGAVAGLGAPQPTAVQRSWYARLRDRVHRLLR
jgi:hypothetical protein